MTALFSSLDNDLTRGHGGLVEEFGGSPLLKGVVLICGWRPGIGMVLKTLDIIMGFGSEVLRLPLETAGSRLGTSACSTRSKLDGSLNCPVCLPGARPCRHPGLGARCLSGY